MGKERIKYGDSVSLHKTMDLKITCNIGMYDVQISNVSSDLLILLADVRNKIRLTDKWYFMNPVYSTVEIDFFVGANDNYKDITTYSFFINSLSKTKVSLTLVEGEMVEEFIVGGDLTEIERERLKDEDREALQGELDRFHEVAKSGYGNMSKKRWDKTKYKKDED